MANRFKDPRKRATYDVYVRKFNEKVYLFDPSGGEYRGSSDRIAFWNGYHGIKAAYAIYESPDSISYPIFRAGQDCGKKVKK